MIIACLDLEGVLIPEVWQNVARRTGIEKLNLTTRDIPDYHELMRYRLNILDQQGVTINDIQDAIAAMEPLPGARAFLDELRARVQVIILSDTYVEFMDSFMEQLGRPTLFCNYLSIDNAGRITNYHLRQEKGKLQAVRALRQLSYQVRAAGDSYNDLEMLLEADQGAFFRPPASIVEQYPALPVYRAYDALLDFLTAENVVHA